MEFNSTDYISLSDLAKSAARCGQLDALEVIANEWRSRAEITQEMADTIRNSAEQQGRYQAQGTDDPKNRTSAALKVMTDIGRPMRTREILSELDKRGVVVGGKRPYVTLFATLIRSKSVRSDHGLHSLTEQYLAERTNGTKASVSPLVDAPPLRRHRRSRSRRTTAVGTRVRLSKDNTVVANVKE